MPAGIARGKECGGEYLRILGLDYGEKRIGVAICDELGITAQGLPTIIRKTKKHDLEIFTNLIKNYNVEKIVIGYPVRIDGSEGIQCEKVNRFAAVLTKMFSLSVIKWQSKKNLFISGRAGMSISWRWRD